MHRGKVREMWELDEFSKNRRAILEMKIMPNQIGTRYFVTRCGVVYSNNGGMVGSLTVDECCRLLKEILRGPDFAVKYIHRTFLGYEVS